MFSIAVSARAATVTIAWDNGHVATVRHGDMRDVQREPVKRLAVYKASFSRDSEPTPHSTAKYSGAHPALPNIRDVFATPQTRAVTHLQTLQIRRLVPAFKIRTASSQLGYTAAPQGIPFL